MPKRKKFKRSTASTDNSYRRGNDTSADSPTWSSPDRYSLPPVDRSEYDVRGDFRTTCHTTEGTVQITTPKKDCKTSKWTEEFLVKSARTGCWCRDCPWLLLYSILMIIWMIAVCLCYFYQHLDYFSPEIERQLFEGNNDVQVANCISACSHLLPPERLTPQEKAEFHCKLGTTTRWQGTAGNQTFKNPNCHRDCLTFGDVGKFLRACSNGYVPNDDPNIDRTMFDRQPIASEYVLEWHWIAHIIVITNTLSLFLLVVPLFFCCMQVVIFSLTCVAVNVALTMLLAYYVYDLITSRATNTAENPTFFYETVFAIISALFTFYVIIVAIFVITKRMKVSCEVARFTSKFVNSVPTVLIEALLTLILLFLWVVGVLLAAITIETRGGFVLDEHPQYAPAWLLWTARALTVIMSYWTAQFIINCQSIIVHGAMARFYFDKELPNRTIKSHVRLVKYHLCTACFAGLLFNWLYWLRWLHPKNIVRSRSLFGTAVFAMTFCRAGKEVNHLLHPPEGSRLRAISKVNPFYFLMHVQAFAIMAIVTHLVFYEWKYTIYIEIILVAYAYFVGLATVNIYRVTKDAIFLCYELDRALTTMNPERMMKMPDEDPYIYARQGRTRIHPR